MGHVMPGIYLKDMVQKDMVQKDMVQKDMVQKDMVHKDMVHKDMVHKDMVHGTQQMCARHMLLHQLHPWQEYCWMLRELGNLMSSNYS